VGLSAIGAREAVRFPADLKFVGEILLAFVPQSLLENVS
jgi:hypothetical protein